MQETLLYFSLKYKGDFNRILEALNNKEEVNQELFTSLKAKLKSNYITILDDDYPSVLKEVDCPPFVLYYYGDISLLKEKYYGVVGTRECSSYGASMAVEVSRMLVKHGYGVVSGMAEGIDCYAHKGCINEKGNTIAVLGCGIDYCYPRSNYELYMHMKKYQLILSEYPYNLPPRKDYFPKRNRIVASLGEKLVVVESKKKGGSMISVGYALDLGKEIICVPQRYKINDGCNYLISLGAKILVDEDDLF